MVDYRDIESKAKELSSIKNLDYYELREKELDLQVYNNIVAKNEKFQKIKKNYLKIIFFYDIFG